MVEKSALAELIRQEIADRGPLPFRRFMELALYHPELGYYSGGRHRVGKEGDFITSVSVGPLFGRLLAHAVAQFWDDLGRPSPFHLVEIGANHGRLFADVAGALAQIDPDLHRIAHYRIIEPFPKLREIQRRTLDGLPVEWVSILQELPDRSVQGVIWSNELFDALPVHRVRRLPSGWAEIYVTSTDRGFDWGTGRASFDWADAPAGFPAHDAMPPGYTTELWPHADFWAGELARVLDRGRVLTIDYGFEAAEYYAAHRTDGTLQTYFKHRRGANPLENVGLQDITAHVNFTALIEAGKKQGLEPELFSTQERFLMNVLKGMQPADLARMTDSEKKQFNTLVHPDLLGGAFKVLVQAKP